MFLFLVGRIPTWVTKTIPVLNLGRHVIGHHFPHFEPLQPRPTHRHVRIGCLVKQFHINLVRRLVRSDERVVGFRKTRTEKIEFVEPSRIQEGYIPVWCFLQHHTKEPGHRVDEDSKFLQFAVRHLLLQREVAG